MHVDPQQGDEYGDSYPSHAVLRRGMAARYFVRVTMLFGELIEFVDKSFNIGVGFETDNDFSTPLLFLRMLMFWLKKRSSSSTRRV